MARATQLIQAGHSVDIGLSQVNSANLTHYGLTVEQAFDPCTNVKTGASILRYNYNQAVKLYGPGQQALRAAISAYNTGSFERGQTYVGAVVKAAGLSEQSGALAHPAKARNPDRAKLEALARAGSVRVAQTE